MGATTVLPSKSRMQVQTRVTESIYQGNACSPGTASRKPSLITYGSCFSPFSQFSVPLPACAAPCNQTTVEAPSISTGGLVIINHKGK